MEETWGFDNRNEDYGSTNLNTFVRINGSTIPVEVGSSFKEVVREMSLDAGFGKFRVFLNGSEIKPSMAPETINFNDKIEIRSYDEAGRR